jgi:hypothetical protein
MFLLHSFQNELREHEPGIIGIGTEPKFAIGQRCVLVQTPEGNVLFDCITFLGEAAWCEPALV